MSTAPSPSTFASRRTLRPSVVNASLSPSAESVTLESPAAISRDAGAINASSIVWRMRARWSSLIPPLILPPPPPPPHPPPPPPRPPPARSRTARQPSSGPPADPPAQHHQQGRAADSGTPPCRQVTRVARGRAATASRAGSRRVTWQLAVQNGLACPGYRAELARQGPARLPPLGRAGPEKRCLALRECQPPAGPAPPHRPSSVEERQQ